VNISGASGVCLGRRERLPGEKLQKFVVTSPATLFSRKTALFSLPSGSRRMPYHPDCMSMLGGVRFGGDLSIVGMSGSTQGVWCLSGGPASALHYLTS
jgi:hypothetical protein